MPVLIVFRFEEGIAECDRLDTLHVDVRDKLRIDVEEHRHVHCLASIQPLLLEAEALYLAEVWRHLPWRHGVCRYANDVLV